MRKMLTALAGAALVVTLATPAGAAMSQPQGGGPGVTHAGYGGRAGDHDHWGRGGDHGGWGHDGWGHRGDWGRRGGDHRRDHFPGR